MKLLPLLPGLLALALFAGCSRDAVPVRYGRDECAHCRMTIVDPRFGAELVTAKGKVLVFDDLGCLFGYQQANPAPGAELYVTDFAHPGKLLPAATAYFLAGDDIRSPMSSGLAAFGTDADRQQALRQFNRARPHGWDDLPKVP